MSKDTITVNMNVYDIPIVVEQLNKLEQENQQLKLDYELYKDNHSYKNYEVEIRDNTIKQLKEVIEEVREVINSPMQNEYAMCKAFDEIEFILDKVKGEDNG